MSEPSPTAPPPVDPQPKPRLTPEQMLDRVSDLFPLAELRDFAAEELRRGASLADVMYAIGMVEGTRLAALATVLKDPERGAMQMLERVVGVARVWVTEFADADRRRARAVRDLAAPGKTGGAP